MAINFYEKGGGEVNLLFRRVTFQSFFYCPSMRPLSLAYLLMHIAFY